MMVEQVKSISRRTFLGLAAAVGLLVSQLRRLPSGTGGGTGGAADPLVVYATLQFGLTGGWTPGGFLATCQLDQVNDLGKSVRLAVSTTADMQNIVVITAPVTSDSHDALARFTVTGLQQKPGLVTKYYCRLMEPSTSNMFGDVFSGWTRMTNVEADYSFDIVLGSCLANANFVTPYGSEEALADAAAQQAPLLLHLGDWGYWGQTIGAGDDYTKDLKKYIGTLNDPTLTQLRTLVHGSNIEACISDHELHANGDTWQPSDGDGDEDGSGGDGDGDEHDAFGCQHSLRQMKAHKKLFPVAVWGDGANGTHHRGYYLDLAPHVRLVVSDLRSPQRNESTDPNHGQTYKQMWGADQENWLFTQAFNVPDDVVILFVNETVWWRNGGDVTDDKPASYPDAQDHFKTRLSQPGSGTRPLNQRFVWLGGDRHYCGYLSTADAQRPPNDGFPQFIGSGFCKNSLKPKLQENMSWRSPVRTDQWAWFPVVGYMKLTLSYVASTRTVTLTGVGRIVESTHRQRDDGVLTLGQPYITSQTAQFNQSTDKDQIIAGHYIPDKVNGQDEVADDTPPVTISSVQSPTLATMTANATHSGTVTFSIASKPNTWSMSTHPTVLPTTEAFQV